MYPDKIKTGGHEGIRISLEEDYEVRDFGVTADEIKAAVGAVCNEASAVEEHLKNKKR